MILIKKFGFKHQGIHPGNVFVDDNLIVLGLPSFSNLWKVHNYEEKSDIIDFGRLMLYLLTGKEEAKWLDVWPIEDERLLDLI